MRLSPLPLPVACAASPNDSSRLDRVPNGELGGGEHVRLTVADTGGQYREHHAHRPDQDHDRGLQPAVTPAGGGPRTATYDATLKAPKCAVVGSSCDSGSSLLLGRDGKGPEPNQPNTISSPCADGTSGTFHSDQSNDRLKVSTVDGTSFATTTATTWSSRCSRSGSGDPVGRHGRPHGIRIPC